MANQRRQLVSIVGSDLPYDSARLGELYRTQWRSLCRYISSRFGAGPPEPEDVAQAAFAKFAALEQPEAIGNPAAFLRRAAHNIAVDAYRHQARTSIILHDLGIAESDNADLSPEDVLSARDELALVDEVIAGLKPKQRVAFLLHRIDGLTFVEIAQRMGISPSGARLLVDTALDACMAAMEERR